jgi:hypothetical protein
MNQEQTKEQKNTKIKRKQRKDRMWILSTDDRKKGSMRRTMKMQSQKDLNAA